jgi:hypothetical protein
MEPYVCLIVLIQKNLKIPKLKLVILAMRAAQSVKMRQKLVVQNVIHQITSKTVSVHQIALPQELIKTTKKENVKNVKNHAMNVRVVPTNAVSIV